MGFDWAANEKWIAKERRELNAKAKEVTRLVEPRTGRRDACIKDAERAVGTLDEKRRSTNHFRLTKEYKDHLRRFASFSRALSSAWNEVSAIGFTGEPGEGGGWISDEFEVDTHAVYEGMEAIVEFGKHCDALAKAPTKLPNNLEAQEKRLAVKIAYWLIV